MSVFARPVRLGVVVALATAAVFGVRAATAQTDATQVVRLTIHNSHFDRRVVTVRADRAVTFVVRNTDPIVHELIVGPDAVQLRHESGNEPFHGAKPGEITLLPGTTGQTTYTPPTDEPVLFACHLPGHFAYGMHGVVRISR